MKFMSRTEYIEHHGILGMKWGVRRYQNEDGSLTNAGRTRYGIKKAQHPVRANDTIAIDPSSMGTDEFEEWLNRITNGRADEYSDEELIKIMQAATDSDADYSMFEELLNRRKNQNSERKQAQEKDQTQSEGDSRKQNPVRESSNNIHDKDMKQLRVTRSLIRSRAPNRHAKDVMMSDFNDLYISHHGIKGQKWGVRNGPPYPLGEGQKMGYRDRIRFQRGVSYLQRENRKTTGEKYKINKNIKTDLVDPKQWNKEIDRIMSEENLPFSVAFQKYYGYLNTSGMDPGERNAAGMLGGVIGLIGQDIYATARYGNTVEFARSYLNAHRDTPIEDDQVMFERWKESKNKKKEE